MAALITSINNGSVNIAGEYSRGLGQYSMRSPAPLAATASSLFPGLFCGRQGTDFSQVTSIDDLTTPAVTDIMGVVARQKVAIGGSVAYADIPANVLPAGTVMDVIERVGGYIYVWAGTALTDPSKVYIATTTTGTGSTLVLAGSVVAAATAGALDISSIATFSAYNGSSFSYAKGDLVSICISDLRR